MAFHPHRFGRYVIVDPIAVGGMAEIYRARLAAAKDAKEGGPDRIIVIKKVIANLSQNTEFLQMFEAEIKITVGLTHPNIVQIYDYGQVSDQSFLAMEYVEGKNLRQFVTRLAEAKSMFSIDMSCHIVSQVCHALSYAHGFKDRFTGKSLHIVHRDISPQNVMISYEGAVKLFDFGIAKAKSAGESTRAGVIKGKPSYLSPEQIQGDELDGRSDIFALGIVLWELLTAKRLFVAENDMAILRMIQSAKIEPPSTFNPAVPQALDAIVMKSLARDREKRYATAEEFQRDLHRFLYSFNPGFNPSDLSYYAKELFDKEIREDRDRLLKYLSMEPVGEDENAKIEAEIASGKKPQKPKESNHRPIEGIMSMTDFNRQAMEDVLATKQNEHAAQQGGQASDQEIEIDAPLANRPESAAARGVTSTTITPGASGKNTKRIDVTGVNWTNRNSLPPGAPRKPGSDVIAPWSKGEGGNTAQINAYMSKRGSRTQSQPVAVSRGSRAISIIAGLCAVLALVFIGGQYGFFEGTPLEGIVPGGSPVKVVARAPAAKDEAKGHDLPPEVRSSLHASTKTSAPLSTPASVASVQEVAQIFVTSPKDKEIFSSLNVYVNDIKVSTKSVGEGVVFSVPTKTSLKVRFTARNRESKTIPELIAEKPQTSGIQIMLPMLEVGFVTFRTTPKAKITFVSDFQDKIETESPLSNFELARGKYTVYINENELINHSSCYQLEVMPEETYNIAEKILKPGYSRPDDTCLNKLHGR